MNYIKIFGLGGLVACTIVLYQLFFIAYFNGYKVLLTINKYNEAHYEAIMLIVLLPMIILFIRQANSKKEK